MKKEDLRFRDDNGTYSFVKSCLFTPIADDDYFKFLNEILEQSDTTEEFTDRFLSNDKYKKMQGYQELLKSERPEKVWYFVRENFGEKCIKIMSDVGGVKVGNDSFSVIFQNGQGDGVTRVAVFDEGELYADNIMRFNTSIQGHFSIYNYDCGGEPIITLDGRYGVYHYEGLVAFVKWN